MCCKCYIGLSLNKGIILIEGDFMLNYVWLFFWYCYFGDDNVKIFFVCRNLKKKIFFFLCCLCYVGFFFIWKGFFCIYLREIIISCILNILCLFFFKDGDILGLVWKKF